MEPLTTSAMIGGIVAYLGQKLSKNESVNSFLSEFTEASVNWIKPLFLKEDGTEKEIIANLKERPESKARQNAVASALEIELEDNPESATFIKDIFEQMSKTDNGGKVVNNIINSKNVNTGNITTGGGNVHIGDAK